MLPDGFRDLDYHSSCVADDLCRYVYDLSTKSGRIGKRLKNGCTDILFESLVEEEGKKHRMIEGSILGKALEGELLGGKIL